MRILTRGTISLLAALLLAGCAEQQNEEPVDSGQVAARKPRLLYYAIPG